MIKLILKWLALSIAVIAAAYIVPGISVISPLTALWVGLVLGLINTFIKPVLKILTLPVNIITLGVFGIILNALLFWLASAIVSGFVVAGFMPALLGSIVVAVITWIADIVL